MKQRSTQYARLIAALRRKAHTTMELIDAAGTVCPWKRLKEAIQYGYVRPGETVVEGTRCVNGKTLKTWRIVKA